MKPADDIAKSDGEKSYCWLKVSSPRLVENIQFLKKIHFSPQICKKFKYHISNYLQNFVSVFFGLLI